jgi:hypothetical protein
VPEVAIGSKVAANGALPRSGRRSQEVVHNAPPLYERPWRQGLSVFRFGDWPYGTRRFTSTTPKWRDEPRVPPRRPPRSPAREMLVRKQAALHPLSRRVAEERELAALDY